MFIAEMVDIDRTLSSRHLPKSLVASFVFPPIVQTQKQTGASDEEHERPTNCRAFDIPGTIGCWKQLDISIERARDDTAVPRKLPDCPMIWRIKRFADFWESPPELLISQVTLQEIAV